jgi:hypothetical protein
MLKLETGVQKAVDWIVGELKANPNSDRSTLIDQAGMRFHLTPLQAEYLYRHFARPDQAST